MKFVTNLGIRKFVSLGVGFPGIPERNLGKSNKIELTHYPLSVGDYSENHFELEDQIASIIEYVMVKNSESKIYIYDDDGFSIVGAVCGVFRRIEGWDTMSAIAECFRFFPSGQFDMDIASLINNFDITRWH